MKYSIAILIFFSWATVHAQILSDPVTPARVPYPQQVGLIGGAGLIAQSGEFNVSCDCPAFEGGRGTGFLIGAIYEDDFFKEFVWGATLTYQQRPIEALYRETENVTVTSPSSGKSFPAQVEFRNTASASFSYLTLMPFVKYIQLHPLFLRAGIGLTTVASAHIVHTKQLLTSTVRSPEGTSENVNVTDADGNIIENTVTVEDGDFPKINSFQLSFDPAIGVDIQLGKSKWYIAPVIQYSLPLMTISENGNDFKLSAWQIMGEVRYAF